MTIKGFNWMLLGTALFVGGCVIEDKGDSGDDGFDTIGDADADADGDADADVDADGDADADADADADGGDGTIDVDWLYVFYEAVIVDGEHSGATYVNSETGEIDDLNTTIQFVFADADDYQASGGSEDYLCRVTWDLSTVSVVDDFGDLGWAGYTGMSWLLDLGAEAPEYAGNCDGAAFGFGVAEMNDWLSPQKWGYGFGPMPTGFEDELSDSMGADYTALGDTPGAAYLLFEAGDGAGGSVETLVEWGYFTVYGFGEGSLIDFESGTLAGVRDSATPTDGYYAVDTVYGLNFGG